MTVILIDRVWYTGATKSPRYQTWFSLSRSYVSACCPRHATCGCTGPRPYSTPTNQMAQSLRLAGHRKTGPHRGRKRHLAAAAAAAVRARALVYREDCSGTCRGTSPPHVAQLRTDRSCVPTGREHVAVGGAESSTGAGQKARFVDEPTARLPDRVPFLSPAMNGPNFLALSAVCTELPGSPMCVLRSHSLMVQFNLVYLVCFWLGVMRDGMMLSLLSRMSSSYLIFG
jgi:hypothetical protein